MTDETIATRVVAAWSARTTTFPVRTLARSMDPNVVIETTKAPHRTTYTFSDCSKATTRGVGSGFSISVVP
jgi:hypothetical protein